MLQAIHPQSRAFRIAVGVLKKMPRERIDDLDDHLRGNAPAAAFSAVRRGLVTTVGPALASAFVAMLLTIACLEAETRRGHTPARRVLWLVYTPLPVPQIAFFNSFQIVLVELALYGSSLAVAWAHVVFVLPYAFLSLTDPGGRSIHATPAQQRHLA